MSENCATRAREARTRAHEGGPVATVTALLERVDAVAGANERVSVGDLLDAVGHRSFAPLLLVTGLVILAPVIGDVPGVPTAMGVLVALTSAQMLLRREHLWIPNWMEERSTDARKVRKAVAWMRPVSGFVDRWTRPRLTRFVGRVGSEVIAATSLLVALMTPVMEFVPFSANFAGVAICAFAVALVARDGLIAVAALAATFATFVVVARALW